MYYLMMVLVFLVGPVHLLVPLLALLFLFHPVSSRFLDLPVTSSGTLTGNLNTQAANSVWAGPSSGSAATPTFRSLVSADIPAINLAASGAGGVTGVLPIANGGTGQSDASDAFDALSPMTTKGDIIYENATPAADRLAIGSTGQVLTVSGGLPVWADPATDGTVTSVALSDGSSTPIYSISGSPVTSSGTLTFTLESQSANMVFAGPSSGSAAQPSFRSLVEADIPSLSDTYLPLAGGTMSGAINMGGYQINDLADPSSTQDAATKGYVDAAINGLTWKGPVAAYAASNVPLTGGATLTIDGYSVQNGDLVLLGNQTTASQNGEYTASGIGTAYTLTANGQPTAAGDAWLVLNGTAYADSAFVATAAVPAAAFVEFAGPNSYSFTSPLNLSGNTVSLHYGTGLTVNSGNLIADISNGLTLSGNHIVVEASDASILVAAGGISVQEDAAGAIVTGGSGIKVQVQNGIQITGNKLDVKLADTSLSDGSSGIAVNLAASSGLVVSSGLAVNPDGSTLDINGSDQLEVKAAGITETQIASSALSATGALAGGSGTKLSVKVDGSTLDINGSDQLEVKAAGVSASQLASGAFDQITIKGGAGTAAYVAQAPVVSSLEVAGESMAASTLWAVRYEIDAVDSGTAGQMYKASDDASSNDLFYVLGLVYSGSSISASDPIYVVQEGMLNIPSHGFTVGAPIYLGAAGAVSDSAPSASNTAIVKLGMAKDANNISVQIEVIGVN